MPEQPRRLAAAAATLAALGAIGALGQQPARADTEAAAAHRATPAAALAAGREVVAATSVAATAANPRRLEFDVFLGDRKIGWQRFLVTPDGGATRIETQARFAVRLLGLKAFEYDHRNVELWRDGCLQSIESRTNSNGTPYRVAGRAQGGSFVVDARTGTTRLTDCVATFAYWDKRKLLGRARLLNSQTGEYVAVDVLPLGTGNVTFGGRSVPVERYALRGRDIDIKIAYETGGGEWVALETRLRGDRLLRYQRRDARLADVSTLADLPRG